MNRLRTIYLSLLFILAMNMTSVLSVKAENYPYRSDYLWLTVPDHADWLYKTGEQAKVEVSFYKYGIPRDGEVNYEIGDDMLKADKKGSFKLKNGRAIVNMGTRKTPGFRDLRLFYKLDGKTYQHHIKVGFSVDKIQPYPQEPKDFDALRNRAHAGVRASYTLNDVLDERARELYCEGLRRTDLIRFNQFGGSQATYNWELKGGSTNGTTFAKTYNVYPLPSSEVLSNKNLTQIDGYNEVQN